MKKNKYNWVVFGLIAVALAVVAYALWQNKKGNSPTGENGGSGNTSGGGNTSSGGTSSNAKLNENTPVGTLKKATDAYTIQYIQNAINNSINYLTPLVSDPSKLPKALTIDGVFGGNTKSALNYLYEKFFDVKNANTKTLSQLRAIIDNSGLQSDIITKIKKSFA